MLCRPSDLRGQLLGFGRTCCRMCVLALVLSFLNTSTVFASEPAAEPEAEEEAEEEDSSEEPETADPPSLCDTQVRLGAVVYMHDHPERSLVMLDIPKSTDNALYFRGMYVDGYHIVAVEPRGVLLQKDETFCWLRLVPDPARPDPPPKRRSKRSKRRK